MKYRLFCKYLFMQNVSFISFFLYPMICTIISLVIKTFSALDIIGNFFTFEFISLIQFFPFLALSYFLNKSLKKVNRFYLWIPLIASFFIPLLMSGLFFGLSDASVDSGYFLTTTIACIISIICFYYSTYHDGSKQEEEK